MRWRFWKFGEKWGNANQFLIHSATGWAAGVIGSLLVLTLNGGAILAFLVGFMNALWWFTAKEATDETVHNKMARLKQPDLWHGWSWKDYLEGAVGGFVGAFSGMGIYSLLT